MDKKLNVCLLNDSFPPIIDGVANVIKNYADIIHRKYGNAVVATPSFPDAVDNYPYPVVRYPSINTTKALGYRTGFPFWPGSILELMKNDVDIIHTHCPFVSTLIARTLRSSINVPIVLTFHSKFDIDIKKAVELGFLQSAAIKFIVSNVEACDEVWVVSEGAGEHLKGLGYTGSYTVMENGVDFPRGRAPAEEIDAISTAYSLDANIPVFLFVGRMKWYKGVRIILDALFKIKAKGTRFKMIFIGDGADYGDITQYTNALKLTDDCIFTGMINDRQKLRAFFSRADMFLFPSTFDTNGIVVREAAACGLASVLIRGSCAAEGITDGRHGILIDENAEALAAAVLRITADLGNAKTMGQNAMKEIYFSWEDAVGKAFARYPAVIEKYKSAQREQGEFQANKLFKLATDIETAMDKLKVHRSEHKATRKHKQIRVKKANKQSDN
jgi:1,2-diacylglycerol 3-alpha-glucosyltransferase